MPKNNTPTGYYKILSFGEVASCQNLGIFVEIMNKILMIFDVENWIWKANFVTFWHQFSKFNNLI